MTLQIDVAFRGHDRLGECPLWNVAERALYWIDALAPVLHRLDDAGRHRSWPMPRPLGSFVFRQRGGLVGAFTGGFAAINLEATIDHSRPPQVELGGHILNDGKCDRRGRYWCGSRAADLASPAAALFRLDPDWGCGVMEEGIAVANGIAWSPDERTMFLADSPTGSIFAYDFNAEIGEIGRRRLFASTGQLGGLPDGATVDEEGRYWCALYGGGAVACFDTNGRCIRTVLLPVTNPTMCAFGGEQMDILYVTSARARLSEAELARQPLAGAVFAIAGLDAHGLTEPAFAG